MNLYRIWYWSMSDGVECADVEAESEEQAIEKLAGDDRKCFAQFKSAQIIRDGGNHAAQ